MPHQSPARESQVIRIIRDSDGDPALHFQDDHGRLVPVSSKEHNIRSLGTYRHFELKRKLNLVETTVLQDLADDCERLRP